MTASKTPDGTEECSDERPGNGGDPSSGGHGEYIGRMRQLTQTIETELIPRLMLAFGPTKPEPLQADGNAGPDSPFPTDIDSFVRTLLTGSVDKAVSTIAALRADGYRLHQIYLDLLAPAARELGRLWEDDDVNFTDVTVGVTRLHRILHVYSHSFCAHEGHGRHGLLKALIMPIPGEQHIFGQLMVIEFFRRAGWTVWSAAPTSVEEIGAIVTKQSFDVVGLSIGAERHLDILDTAVDTIRKRSSNPGVRILLGGSLCTSQPGIASEHGADGMAHDGQEAVTVAFDLVNTD